MFVTLSRAPSTVGQSRSIITGHTILEGKGRLLEPKLYRSSSRTSMLIWSRIHSEGPKMLNSHISASRKAKEGRSVHGKVAQFFALQGLRARGAVEWRRWLSNGMVSTQWFPTYALSLSIRATKKRHHKNPSAKRPSQVEAYNQILSGRCTMVSR